MTKPRSLLITLLGLLVYALIGLAYGHGFYNFSNQPIRVVSVKVRNLLGTADIPLSREDNYILKTWGDDIPDRVTWNGQRIIHSYYRPRKQLNEFYYWIPSLQVRTDVPNRLEVNPRVRFTYKISNHIVAADFGAIGAGTTRSHTLPRTQVLFASIFVCLAAGTALAQFLRKKLSISPRNIFFILTIPHIPALTLFALLIFLQSLLNINFVILPVSFVGFFAFLFLLSLLPAVFLLKLLEPRVLHEKAYALPSRITETLLFKTWQGFKIHQRAAAISIIFLIFSAAALAFRLSVVAEIFANITFFSLIAAVFFSFRENSGSA